LARPSGTAVERKDRAAQFHLRAAIRGVGLDPHAGKPALGHPTASANAGRDRWTTATGQQPRPALPQGFHLNPYNAAGEQVRGTVRLREIYDGKWTRYIGTDGGKPLHWTGKLGLVFGCTGAIDTQYSVSDALGNRFLLSRLEPGEGQLRWSLKHVGGKTSVMRRELADSVNLLFAAPRPDPQELCEHEIERLERVTELVVRLRGAVERDRYRRELDAIYGAEGPARLGLALERLLAGLDVLGVERKTAFDVIVSVALDSTPPLRRSTYRLLCGPLNPLNPPPPNAAVLKIWTTKEVGEVMGLPSVTVRRGLEELTSYGLAVHYPGKQGVAGQWRGIVLP
jgi:hypothetical protein